MTATELIELFVSITGIWVAACYFLLGLIIFPTLRTSPVITINAGVFFTSCALFHLYISTYAHVHSIGMGVGTVLLVLHVSQAIAASAVVYGLRAGHVIIRISNGTHSRD
jgi:hypothetical protein